MEAQAHILVYRTREIENFRWNQMLTRVDSCLNKI